MCPLFPVCVSCVCVFSCFCECAPHAFLVPSEARRGGQIPGGMESHVVVSHRWVPGREPRNCGRAANPPTPEPSLLSFFRAFKETSQLALLWPKALSSSLLPLKKAKPTPRCWASLPSSALTCMCFSSPTAVHLCLLATASCYIRLSASLPVPFFCFC